MPGTTKQDKTSIEQASFIVYSKQSDQLQRHGEIRSLEFYFGIEPATPDFYRPLGCLWTTFTDGSNELMDRAFVILMDPRDRTWKKTT